MWLIAYLTYVISKPIQRIYLHLGYCSFMFFYINSIKRTLYLTMLLKYRLFLFQYEAEGPNLHLHTS